MDEDRSLLFGREAGGFGGLTLRLRFTPLSARLFRVFELHLLRERLEGFELVHAFIIEQIF